jgi:hypothetical protein
MNETQAELHKLAGRGYDVERVGPRNNHWRVWSGGELVTTVSSTSRLDTLRTNVKRWEPSRDAAVPT